MIFRCIAMVGCLLFGSLLCGENISAHRTVSVCVLNDSTSGPPVYGRVSKKTSSAIVKKISRDYQRHVGISFAIVEYHDTTIPPFPGDANELQLRDACAKGEVVAVFTDQQLLINWQPYVGYSNPWKGIVWNYIVERRRREWKLTTRFRLAVYYLRYLHQWSFGVEDERPQATFRHEMAHLFWVSHSKKNVDFMYGDQNNSSHWSNRIIGTIMENRDRSFPER